MRIRQAVSGFILAAALASFPAALFAGQKEETGGSRLDRQEAQIEALKKEIEEIKSRGTEAEGLSGYDHGFFVKSADGNYSFKFRFFAQLFYEYDGINDSPDVNTFGIRRARVLFSGNVFNPNLTYMMMSELVSQYNVPIALTQYTVVDSAGNTSNFNVSDTTDRNFRLLYLWAQYRFCDEFQIRGGEFIPPTEFFFRASNLLMFEDFPSIATTEPFTPNFQTGLSILGTIAGKLDYEAFAVNGSNFDQQNINKAFRTGLSLTYNILGKPGLGVSDVDYSEAPQLALTVAGAYEHPDRVIPAPVNFNPGDNVYRGQANAVLRYRGFSLVPEAIVIYNNTQHFRHWAFAGQLGYFIVPRRFEVAGQANYLRYSGDRNDRAEYSGGFNYYFYGQPVKFQIDYSYLRNTRAASVQTDHRIRTGVQVGFF